MRAADLMPPDIRELVAIAIAQATGKTRHGDGRLTLILTPRAAYVEIGADVWRLDQVRMWPDEWEAVRKLLHAVPACAKERGATPSGHPSPGDVDASRA